MTGRYRIRELTAQDWPEVARIWSDGISTRNATFESEPPSWQHFDATRSPHLRLVAGRADGGLAGWAAAGPVSGRRVYAGVAEHSVYVDPAAGGSGLGRALLHALIALADATGTWTLRSGIFPENAASLRLHHACGFARLGVQQRVGRRDGRWRDVVLVERRSPTIGGDEPLVRLALPGPDDAGAVRGLLTGAGLPLAGLDDAWRTWVADADGTGGTILAATALERHRDTFLLRSVVVDPPARGSGLGRRLVRTALTVADLALGRPAPVCLLTTTADGWFDRFGFASVTRADLPPQVLGSAELTGACPDAARAYLRRGQAVGP
jgi:phosphinothricin acetyltransferase